MNFRVLFNVITSILMGHPDFLRKLLIFISFLTLALTAHAEIIPAAHLFNWRANINVGIPGGIPTNRTHLINVVNYGADKTGVTNIATAFNSALAAAVDGDVIYFPNGIYYSTGMNPGTKHVTIRGQSSTGTILDMHGSGQSSIHFGYDTQYPWNYSAIGTAITNGLTQGNATLTVVSTNGFGVGDIAIISENDTSSLPSVDVTSSLTSKNVRRQMSIVKSVSGKNITIDPPLMWTMTAALNPRVARMDGKRLGYGIESIRVSQTNSTAAYGIWFEECVRSWAKDIVITPVQNGIIFGTSFQCEARQCQLITKRGSGNNHSGFLLDRCSSMLLEDNITIDVFPHYEINSTSGSVFAYNFLHISEDTGLMSMSMDGNHGPHSQFNLYEGNIGPKFGSDGYFGSSSDCTVLRNWWHGTDPRTDQYSICIQLERFTRYYNIVGNILGATNYSYSYDNNKGLEDGSSYSARYYYTWGLPNIGNPSSNGRNAPPWADYSSDLGSLGQGRFQERDTNVWTTSVVKGNWIFPSNGIPSIESIGTDTIPNSYFRTKRPAFFQGLVWPLDGATKTWTESTNAIYSVAIIPAQARYFGLPIPPGPPDPPQNLRLIP